MRDTSGDVAAAASPGRLSVPAELCLEHYPGHTCSSPNSVEFEGWEVQFEAAESRTEDKDLYLRGETFTLFRHRKVQP